MLPFVQSIYFCYSDFFKIIYISENLCFHPLQVKAGDFPEDSCEGGQMREEQNLLPVNRKYKDTFFRMLFREKKELMQLYNAVNGSSYTNVDELQIVTLENAVYMNMKNDLAFVVDFHLNLYEHQSTENPNMPLRNLLYVARQYQAMVREESLYSRKQIKLPTPHFVVFYNGSQRQPEQWEQRLSDAYYSKEKEPELELKVTVLNINQGNNEKLKEQCETLKQYMQYVERIRKYAGTRGMSLEEAVERSISECIKEGILADFLARNRAEAMSVCFFEYDEEKEIEKYKRAEREYIREEVTKEVREEFEGKIREELRGEVTQELREEVKEEVTQELREEVTQEIREEVKEEFEKELLTRMMEANVSLSQMAQYTGRTEDEIKALLSGI